MKSKKPPATQKMTKEARRAKYTQLHRLRQQKEDRKHKFAHVVCFHCRKKGHAVADCPATKAAAVCFRCGSTAHALKDCPRTGTDLPFADCFVCRRKGHLASACPENDKGVYVNGGACKECGSKRHLVTACPERKRKKDKAVFETSVEDLLEPQGNNAAVQKDGDDANTQDARMAGASDGKKTPPAKAKRKVVKF
jgi:zinc finger CCHC domain-containing protein 9